MCLADIGRGRRAISNTLLEFLHSSTTRKQEPGHRTDLLPATLALDRFGSRETVLAGRDCSAECSVGSLGAQISVT